MTATIRPTRAHFNPQLQSVLSDAKLGDFEMDQPVIILDNSHNKRATWILGNVDRITTNPLTGDQLVWVTYDIEVDVEPGAADTDTDYQRVTHPFTPERLLPGTPSNLSWLRGRHELAIAKIDARCASLRGNP